MPKLSSITKDAISGMVDMWSSLDHAREQIKLATLSTRPQNSFTLLEYADKYNLPRTTAQCQLQRMMQSGKVLRQHVNLPDSGGRMHRTAVYSLIKRSI